MQFDKKFYTVKEVINLCSIGKTSVYNAINNNKIKAVKFGSKTLICADSLESFVNNLPVINNDKEGKNV